MFILVEVPAHEFCNSLVNFNFFKRRRNRSTKNTLNRFLNRSDSYSCIDGIKTAWRLINSFRSIKLNYDFSFTIKLLAPLLYMIHWLSCWMQKSGTFFSIDWIKIDYDLDYELLRSCCWTLDAVEIDTVKMNNAVTLMLCINLTIRANSPKNGLHIRRTILFVCIENVNNAHFVLNERKQRFCPVEKYFVSKMVFWFFQKAESNLIL